MAEVKCQNFHFFASCWLLRCWTCYKINQEGHKYAIFSSWSIVGLLDIRFAKDFGFFDGQWYQFSTRSFGPFLYLLTKTVVSYPPSRVILPQYMVPVGYSEVEKFGQEDR